MTSLFILAGRHWRLIGLAVLIALLTVQSARLGNAKADLRKARSALIEPATGETWKKAAGKARTASEACAAIVATHEAATAALASETARKLALAEKGRADARAVAESYRRTLPAVRAYQPRGSDACARSADVDAMIRGDLTR